MKKYLYSALILMFLISALPASFAQETKAPQEKEEVSLESIKKIVQDVLQDMELEKAKQQEELITKLKKNLDMATQDWITAESRNRDAELNQFLHVNWENLSPFTNPIPYDFYLRDYTYSLAKEDVLKTDSLNVPYKGYAEVTEKLYIETYYPSNIDDPAKYQYTITRQIAVNLDYRQDKFTVTNTQYKETYIEQGWQDRQILR